MGNPAEETCCHPNLKSCLATKLGRGLPLSRRRHRPRFAYNAGFERGGGWLRAAVAPARSLGLNR